MDSGGGFCTLFGVVGRVREVSNPLQRHKKHRREIITFGSVDKELSRDFNNLDSSVRKLQRSFSAKMRTEAQSTTE